MGQTWAGCALAGAVALFGFACGATAPRPTPVDPISVPVGSLSSSSETLHIESAPPAPPASSSPPSRFACAPKDRGIGSHAPFVTRGKLKISVPAVRPASHKYDVVFHFHFSDAARRTIVHAAPDVVIAGFDLGEGSRVYGDAMSDPRAFVKLLSDVEAVLNLDRRSPSQSRSHRALFLERGLRGDDQDFKASPREDRRCDVSR